MRIWFNVAGMEENDLARVTVDAAFRVHSATGPGLLESVYEVLLTHELRKHGLDVKRQVPIQIRYDGIVFNEGFRADIVLNDSLLIEVKSVQKLEPVHSKQVLTYLRLSDRRLGLLINFGEALIKNGIKRIVNGLPDEAVPDI